jgi:hypothetical protein
MNNRTYFHVCPLLLEAGSIIKPGNWGRVIATYHTDRAPWHIAVRELCYENVRLNRCPENPSRLNSVFLFDSHAQAFNHIQINDDNGLIYEVELIEEDARLFHGDMALTNIFPADTVRGIPFYTAQAEQYWQGLQNISGSSEFLTQSPIRILKSA